MAKAVPFVSDQGLISVIVPPCSQVPMQPVALPVTTGLTVPDTLSVLDVQLSPSVIWSAYADRAPNMSVIAIAVKTKTNVWRILSPFFVPRMIE